MAFTQKQLYPVPFAAGIDTKTDPKQVMAGNLLSLQNGLLDQTGKINKRTGATVLSNAIMGSANSSKAQGSSYITSAQAIASYFNEMLLFDGLNVYSYIAETQSWSNKGIAASVITQNRQIVRNQAEQLNPDMAFLDNAEVYVWEDTRGGAGGSVRYSVVDSTTQAIIYGDQAIGNGYTKPKAIAFNGEIFIFFTDASNNLFYILINPNNPTAISVPVNVASDGYILSTTNFAYDVAVIGNNMYVAYLQDISTVPKIGLFHLDQSFTKSTITTVATGSQALFAATYGVSVMSIVGDSFNNIWVTWATGQTTYSAAYTSPGALILGPTKIFSWSPVAITSIESNITTGKLVIIAEQSSAASYNEALFMSTLSQTGTVVFESETYSVGLASKAYNVNGQIYVNAAYQTALNSTYFTLLIPTNQAMVVVGKVNPSVGGGLRTNTMLSEIPLCGTKLHKFANLTKGEVISEGNTIFTLLGVNSTTLDYDNPNKFQCVTQNNNLQIVGGVLQIYDGVSVVESNFHYPPENIQVAPTGSGSGLGTGSYQYIVTYEWIDNNGNIEISTPSIAVTANVTAGQNVQVNIPNLRLTKKVGARAVNICVYRTAANGSVFNEVTSVLAPTQNNFLGANTLFVDTLSDVSASSNRFLYTTGGVLDNVAPPANSLITLYQNRVVLSGMEDPNLIWFSQNKQDYTNYSTTPTNFAAELTIGCDSLGGPITAIKNMNQNLVIFKKSNIFIVNGDGPNNTGGGNSYPNPQLLTSADVGCSNQNSITLIPASADQSYVGGLLFQSDKGFYLLDQGLNIRPIGAPAYAYNDLTITSNTLVPDKNTVIFTTLEGTSLVYDYYHNQWMTNTNQSAIDSIVFQNLFTYVTANGTVYQNNESIFTDGGQPISLSWTSPNFNFAQLNGWCSVFSVYLLGTYKGPHRLNVAVAYNNSPTYTEFATVDLTQASSNVWGSSTDWGSLSPWGGTFTPYEFKLDFKNPRCSSIRIQVSDSQSSNYNEGYSISAMTFVVGILPGGNKLPATQQYGTS